MSAIKVPNMAVVERRLDQCFAKSIEVLEQHMRADGFTDEDIAEGRPRLHAWIAAVKAGTMSKIWADLQQMHEQEAEKL